MTMETQKDTDIMTDKPNRIAWRKPQLTEARIEDVTSSNGPSGAADSFSNMS